MTDTAITETQWIARLQDGCVDAIEFIFHRYLGRTQRLAERRLAHVSCREADEEDVAISAMYSLFRGVANNRFPELCTGNDLWRLLAVITARKAVQQTRRQYCVKRGNNTVRGESVFLPADDLHNGGLAEAAVAPEQHCEAEVREWINQMLDALNDEVLREIAVLKLQGHSNLEIAQAINVVTRTVERKLARIRDIWARSGLAAV